MGCGGSRITAVKPVRSGELNGEDDTGSKQGCRGESAVSKFTTDSGVVLEAEEFPALPGTLARVLPSLAAHRSCLCQEVERPKSSEILEQLLSQGLITTVPRERLSGEAYNILIDGTETPKRRLPPRLESLKGKRNESITKDDIEERMRHAEGRRKLREEELKVRLRTKSARVRNPVAATTTREGGGTGLVEVPSAGEIPPTVGGVPPDPWHPGPLLTLGEGDGGSGGLSERGGQILSASLVENDSTFQQAELMIF
ncbi:stathmin domain-containing protein 1 [Esox lucius]|uniref:Stathmin domain containing 1 n=1 Tax=Esox lucius TaxID=8010 RepID=A0A3P8YT85_ESOLU|nr:stathmin domain-containing protein 1 [Esox lucius]